MQHLLVFLGLFVLSSCQTFHGPTYQKQPASVKLSQLFNAITEDLTGLPWYGTLEEAELFVEAMNTSFWTTADDMPYQFLGLELRKKLIHTVGVIAAAKFVITNNSFGYSGLFDSGCDNAIVRLSLAKQPEDGSCTDSCLAPGVSVKLLRDGVSSATFLGLYSLLGQSSFNFFAHDFSTQPPDFGDWVPFTFQLLRDKFATASDFPTMLGLSHIATYDQKGQPSSKVNFPFRIVFHPTTAVHRLFPDKYTGIPFQLQLLRGLTPGPLFEIYAQDSPMDPTLNKIGEIVLTTKATTSTFGDQKYFIQHHAWEDDLKWKPEWYQPALQNQQNQMNTPSPGYYYPDLPWTQ